LLPLLARVLTARAPQVLAGKMRDKRLAKRDQAPTLAGLRAAGIGPDEVRTKAGFPGPVASFAPA
jgi:hypothetical protein